MVSSLLLISCALSRTEYFTCHFQLSCFSSQVSMSFREEAEHTACQRHHPIAFGRQEILKTDIAAPETDLQLLSSFPRPQEISRHQRLQAKHGNETHRTSVWQMLFNGT